MKTHTSSYQILTENKSDNIPDSYKKMTEKLIAFLKWGQRQSINKWVSIIVICFFEFWLALVPLLIQLRLDD